MSDGGFMVTVPPTRSPRIPWNIVEGPALERVEAAAAAGHGRRY